MSNLPRIGIVGYGQMGKQIEKLAHDNGFVVSNTFDITRQLKENETYDFDVAIDFSFPDTVIKNVMILAKHKKNIVLGTTGWYDYEDKIREIVEQNDIGLVWGSNFSIGMQLFNKIVASASKLLNPLEDFDAFMHEIHHKRKKDSPSGTSLTLANIILENLERKNNIEIDKVDGEIAKDTLHVSSSRGGDIVGTHTVYLDSISDTIELTHRAKNRNGFALGSLTAAKWIKGKKGFHNFEEVMDSLWNV